MQERLTYRQFKTKNKAKKKTFQVLFLVLVFVLMFFVVFAGVFIKNIKSRNQFLDKTYYAISLGSYLVKTKAEAQALVVSNQGGAGVVYMAKNKYYVLGFAYVDKASANVVKSGLSKDFSPEIVEIKTQKIKTKVQRKILGCPELSNAYLFFINQTESLYNTICKFEKDKISRAELYKTLTKAEMRAKQHQNCIETLKCNGTTKAIAESLNTALECFISQCEITLGVIYKGVDCHSNLKKLFVFKVLLCKDLAISFNKL